jgi:hypothetical protein
MPILNDYFPEPVHFLLQGVFCKLRNIALLPFLLLLVDMKYALSSTINYVALTLAR